MQRTSNSFDFYVCPLCKGPVTRGDGAHIFELPELEGYLAQAGFEGFRPQTYGSVLVFSARKGR